ncbi:long-chain-fatty-acid--CoA ligase 1 isoform X2 [Nematostella vectensis]|uniref:long-chain-fatty-acid--CoA ligase 1 isoform X2 n=1 Tax=Nematostella vectensis TaxID=45351 RepID=UPI0020774EFA|nr:long-chain-fatty-acid--CoA ligase 1 isoform X2 [Nematostella vectensis]
MKARNTSVELPEMQSVEIEGGGGARRSNLSHHDVTRFHDDVNTVYEAFLRGMRMSDNGPFLGTRQATRGYKWATYSQIHERASNFGSGLCELGCDPSQETFVGLWSTNCTEWLLADLACQMFSMVTVPIYDSHGSEACTYIINKAKLSTIVCHKKKVNFLLEHAHLLPTLKSIIVISGAGEVRRDKSDILGIRIISFDEVEKIGINNPHEKVPARPEDTFTISWTSGTTGFPKGVILTHDNIISDMSAYLFLIKQDGEELTPQDTHLSYLPPEHMYERCTQVLMMMAGAKIGLYHGKREFLMDDFKALRPTVFAAVPRLLNAIYDKVTAQVSRSKIKKWIFGIAIRSKEQDLKRRIIRKDTIWDRLVFKKIQDLIGGNVRIITCGSAPLSARVTSFIRCVMGCYLNEGYGSTETTAMVTMQRLKDFNTGHVGAPVPCATVKLVDVPEMDYYASNNQGEICIRGRNVFKGYLHDAERTEEAFDSSGWFYSGDIGEWTQDGTLRIIDRKKHIFKLSQGEYIAPAKIQNAYLRSMFVAQVFVHGNSLKSFIVAVVVPDAEVLIPWAKTHDIEGGIKQLCQNQTVRQAIHDDMIAKGKEAKLNSLEQVKGIYLHPELFTVEEGLLTPTLKTKRPALAQFFEEKLNVLYEDLEAMIKRPQRNGW